MNLKNIYLLLVILVLASCKKTDQNQPLILPALIDTLTLVDYPGIECKVKSDTTPYLVTNTVNLPYQTSFTQIKLRIHTVNATKLVIEQIGKDGTINPQTFLLEPGTNSINTTIDYYKPVSIKLYDHDFVSAYVLRINKNQLPDPDFTNLSLNINPNNLTPLAGILSVSSSEAVSVAYTVKGQDGDDFTSQNAKRGTDNKVNLFGLYPNSKNTIKVIITNEEGSMSSKDLYVTTGMLPPEFPDSTDITVKKLDTQNAKTKFILYYPYKTVGGAPFKSPGNMSFPIVLDNHGKVRWYMTTPFVMDMKPMPNGHFLLFYYNYLFREIDLMGNVYKEIYPPTNCHHAFELLPNGNILYTGTDLSINQTEEDKIYEIDYQTGAIVKMINLYDILDPSRQQQPSISTSPNDWFHNNSLTYDATDNSIVITGRHQSTICKLDYATNQVKWIISDPSYWKTPWINYLLQPSGNNFEYAWGQHSIVLNPADHNKLIVFDNGNARSYTNPLKPNNSYSRLVEYSIDPKNKTVSQIFDFGKELGSENYSPALGSVDYVSQNLFVCFPLIIKDANGNAANFSGSPSIRFMEVDRNKNVLLDIRVRNNSGNQANGYRTYRGHPFSFGE